MSLLLCALLSLAAVSACKIQVTGTDGIGVYQDETSALTLKDPVLVWKSFYARESGTTFFSVVPSDVYISIMVVDGPSGTVESKRVLAPPGTAWTGAVYKGKITEFSQTGTCTWPCVLATVGGDLDFGGDSVWVRVYKADLLVMNHSLPSPGSARFMIDQSKLYFVWGQREAQVPVTDEMRANAFRADLTACNSDENGPPIILKFFATNTLPYYIVEQPRLDPLGSGCGPANGPDCVSVTFHGQYSTPMQVAVFAEDQQWVNHRNESYRPIMWQRLTSSQEGAVYSFPFDQQLFVGALVFTTEPASELNYIITGLHPAHPGQVFEASTDDGGIPWLARDAPKSPPNTITIHTTNNWQPKHTNTSLVVMKNGVPIAASGVMAPNQDFVFQLDQTNLFFRGNNQFNLYQRIQDSDIDKATGFAMQNGRKFLGVKVVSTSIMQEFSATQRCALTKCNRQGNCNENTGLCECYPSRKGVECSYSINNCDGIDCGVHGYCSVNTGTWQCNCVDQWSGVLCQVGPDQTVPKPASPLPSRTSIAIF